MGALASYLIACKYPEKWARPKLHEYKGTIDPEVHIVKFLANMEDVTGRRDLWCHMFVRTLEDEAMNWYINLPAESIHTFEELKERFKEAFNQLRYK